MSKFLSTAEAAARLDTNERHVRWLIEHGKLTAQRVGRAHLVEVESLGNWKRSKRGVPKSKGRKGLKKSRKKRPNNANGTLN